MHESKRRSFSIFSLLFLLVSVAGFLAVTVYRQPLLDRYYISQYEPTSAEQELREHLALTPLGREYYDASRVKLQTAEQFNQSCQQQSETNNPILGCYSAQKIFVYDIANQKLEGIEETTAAHEVLHAAYERMSDADKSSLQSLLEAAYEKVKTPELEERMEFYAKNEPGERINELHSILGSEQPDLGTELEAHYKKYFTDRSKIVAYYQSYSAVFTSVSAELKALEKDINDSTGAVNTRIADYNTAAATFESDSKAFETRNNNGEFEDAASFNLERSALVARKDTLDNEREAITNEITRINSLREQYNALVGEYNELNKSINSSLSPSPSL